jgi:hypothetical protein
MSNEAQDTEFFTTKHNRLVNIAKVAKVFAIIIFIFYGLTFASSIYGYFQGAYGIYWQYSFHQNFDIFVGFLSNLIRGITIGIALLGISYGLNMIVETDLNYRLKKEEASND